MARRSQRRDILHAVMDPQTEWTRRKLLGLAAGILVVGLGLVAGLVWSVLSAFTAGEDSSATVQAGQSERDDLANRPLPQAPLEASQPGELSAEQGETLRVPLATEVGPAAVASGFEQSPEGALAQLVAIDQAALSSASVQVAQEVISEWAVEGGPSPETWSGVEGLAELLQSAGVGADGSGQIAISVEAQMGFIKGTVGDNFVVPCVDLVLTVTTTDDSRQAAAADCQRMVWRSGRWMIGTGPEPAPAPSLWPGSQASLDVGYQWLEQGS